MSGISPGSPVPYLQKELIGSLKNIYPTRSRGFVFGRAPVVNNTRVDLWEGPTPTYVNPVAGLQLSISSLSANDTAGGTGILKLHIHYLDTNYAIQNEQVTLNGLGIVLTQATNIFRINGVHAILVGSLGDAAGDISLTSGGVTYAIIKAGFNTCRQAIFTVPAGYTGYITNWTTSTASTGNHFAQCSLRATTHDGVLWPGAYLLQDEYATQNNGSSLEFGVPIPIPATSDVKISSISDAVNANVVAFGRIMGYFDRN